MVLRIKLRHVTKLYMQFPQSHLFKADLVFYLEECSFVDVIIEAVCSSRRHHHCEREVPGVA